MLWFLSAGWIASASGGLARGDEVELPEPVFAPPPRLAITAEEWTRWQAASEVEKRRPPAVARGEALLKEPVKIPDGWGNWIFYYACNDDGTSLEAQSLTEHRCPRCGKVQSDERTVAAYRTMLHSRADQAALDLGWAYRLSGDDRFAAEARRILLAYAAAYPKYPARRDRWGREGIFATIGGRRYCQSLDEAVGVLPLAKAYDLTRTSSVWSDEDRRLVERDLFGTVAAALRFWNYDTINHQTWYNAGLLAIANVTADRELARKVIAMRGGYRDQLARAIGPDGMWREGTMAYHSYALQAMQELVDAGRGLGWKLHEEPGLRRMFEFPRDYAYPSGQFPAINDSDAISLAGFGHHAAWFERTFAQPPTALTKPSDRSLDLPGAGVVVLRQGQGEAAACAMLDYGEHGGGHGHPDKLQLLLFADGRERLLDPGRLDYSHREHKTWYRQTAAHNTVTIDGRSQSPTEGKLRWLKLGDGWQACSAECTTAYRGATITRSLLLSDDCLIDLCTVAAPAAKTIDGLLHAAADAVSIAEASSAAPAEPLGTTDGYEHFSDVLRWSPVDPQAATKTATFTARTKSLRVWLPSPPGGAESLYSARCPGYSLEPKIPCLIRRVTGAAATFAVVYDWSAGDRRLTAASLDATGGITIVRASGVRSTVRFTADGPNVSP